MKSTPNIIFIIADDHRSSSIGAHGCEEIDTPNLDALVSAGTDFTNAHCQGGFNGAVCVPSRASFLTGRSVFDLTAPDERLADDFSAGACVPPAMPTLPERLREAGYHTHAVGKWHNDKATFTRGFASAENILFDGMSEHDNMVLQDFDPNGNYDDERARFVPGHSTDIFRDAALRYLNTTKQEQPFFLYLAFTAPHDPRTPPDAFKVDPETVSLPVAYAPVHPFDNGEALVRDEELATFPRQEMAIRQHLADYYGMITHLDDAIGKVLAESEKLGLLDNTIIVYTSDHGLGLGSHGLMGKQNLYEHSLCIPLIFAGPSVPSRQSRDALVWHGDTHATLLALAGLEPAPQCAGNDLVPLMLDDQEQPPRSYFGAAYRSSQRMICDQRYKLIRYFRARPLDDNAVTPNRGSELEQLFDLEADPDEQINLIFISEHSATRERLSAALDAWQRQENDHLLISA